MISSEAHDLGVGSLICLMVYQYLKSDNVEFHAVLFSCCLLFYKKSKPAFKR